MKKTNAVIIFLLTVTVCAVAVTIWTLFHRPNNVILIPDYAPVETEAHAEPLPGDQKEPAKSSENGGFVSLMYSNSVTIDLNDSIISLLFGNPGNSNQDMVIQLIIQDTLIVQSGRLTPGHQVTKLDITEDVKKLLQPGGYEGTLCVHYYNMQNAEKALVSTDIPVHIIVK